MSKPIHVARSGTLGANTYDELTTQPVATHPDSHRLIDYWRGRVGDGGFVFGRDIPARPIAKLLDRISVLEPVRDRQDFCIRIAGEGLRRRFQRDITGDVLSQYAEGDDLKKLLETARLVIDGGEPHVTRSRRIQDGLVIFEAELVGLRILAPDQRTPWLLSSTFYFD